MIWRAKALVQKSLAAAPRAWGDSLYVAIQRTAGSLRRTQIAPFLRTALEFDEVLRGLGVSIAGSRVLEIGAGRRIGLPMALWLLGSERITTVDLHRYLRWDLVLRDLEALRALHDEHGTGIAGWPGFHRMVPERVEQLLRVTDPKQELPALLNLEYRAPFDARATGYKDGSFDLVTSKTVVEHIPPTDLLAILREARRVLRPRGVSLHEVDFSDHFSHMDRSLLAINFLRFSETAWSFWAGNRFMYQNRMRFSEVLRQFEHAGFSPVLAAGIQIDAASLRALRAGFPLDRRFRGFEFDDLATVRAHIAGVV